MDKYKYPEKQEKLYEKLKNEKIFEKNKKSNINVDEDIKPVLRMPKKNINANIVKGKIMQFIYCII